MQLPTEEAEAYTNVADSFTDGEHVHVQTYEGTHARRIARAATHPGPASPPFSHIRYVLLQLFHLLSARPNTLIAALEKACERKLRETAELCRQEGLVFLPFAMETLGGLHPGAVTQVKQIGAALARSKGLEESVATSQLFGRISLTLMRGNSVMLASRCQEDNLLPPYIDGVM